jgi:pyruvate dehydrogenase E1 component beta subunit
MPTTPRDAKGLLAAAIRDDNPVIFLEHRWLYDTIGAVPEGAYTVPIGRASVLRPGSDATVVAVSWMNVEALKAAEVIQKKHGAEVEVVDPRSIYPLDVQTIVDSVNRTGHAVVADCDWTFCGFSSEVACLVSEHCFPRLKKPVTRLGFAHAPCPTTRCLENEFYPGAPEIIRAVEKLLGLPTSDLSDEEFYSYEKKFKGPF